MSQNPENPKDQKNYFSMVLAEVVFSIPTQGIQVVRRQIIEKSDVATYNTRHLSMIQNRAAQEVANTIPEEYREAIEFHDVLLGNIIPLGYMTDEEFFGPDVEEVVEPVAADETPVTDNVTQFPTAG